MTQYEAFIDGGSRGNPGLSASAFALSTKVDGVYTHQLTRARYIGTTTNNVAEYKALGLLVEELATRPGHQDDIVKVYCDSLLVVNQMSDVWRTKDENLCSLRRRILDSALTAGILMRLIHVPRAKNIEADKAVNLCLDYVQDSVSVGLRVTKMEKTWTYPVSCSSAEWHSKNFTNL